MAQIRWYFAEADAQLYPFGHVYEPVMYNVDRYPVGDTAGEVPHAQRVWYNGHNPGVDTTGVWCGTEADFEGDGDPPLSSTGDLDFAKGCSCAMKPTIGCLVSHRLTKRTRLVLELAASARALTLCGAGLSLSTTCLVLDRSTARLQFRTTAQVVKLCSATLMLSSLCRPMISRTAGLALAATAKIIHSVSARLSLTSLSVVVKTASAGIELDSSMRRIIPVAASVELQAEVVQKAGYDATLLLSANATVINLAHRSGSADLEIDLHIEPALE